MRSVRFQTYLIKLQPISNFPQQQDSVCAIFSFEAIKISIFYCGSICTSVRALVIALAAHCSLGSRRSTFAAQQQRGSNVPPTSPSLRASAEVQQLPLLRGRATASAPPRQRGILRTSAPPLLQARPRRLHRPPSHPRPRVMRPQAVTAGRRPLVARGGCAAPFVVAPGPSVEPFARCPNTPARPYARPRARSPAFPQVRLPSTSQGAAARPPPACAPARLLLPPVRPRAVAAGCRPAAGRASLQGLRPRFNDAILLRIKQRLLQQDPQYSRYPPAQHETAERGTSVSRQSTGRSTKQNELIEKLFKKLQMESKKVMPMNKFWLPSFTVLIMTWRTEFCGFQLEECLYSQQQYQLITKASGNHACTLSK